MVGQCLSADPSQRPSSMLSILYRLYPDEEGRDRDEARQRRHRESLRGMEVGHYEAARADWAELCQENPADGESANNLGVALSRLGRLEEACEAFRHAIQLRPSCPVVAFNLGWALYESGRKQAAIEALDRALALGSSPRALHVRGLCRGGQPAVSDFLAALRNDPQQTISYLALADELEALEQHEDARLMRGQAEEQLLPPREIWPELLLGSVEVPPHWSGGQNWPPRPSAPEHETNLPEDDDSDWDEGGSDDDGGARVPLRRPPHAPSASEAKALPHPYEISRHDPRYLRRAEEG